MFQEKKLCVYGWNIIIIMASTSTVVLSKLLDVTFSSIFKVHTA